MESKSSTTKDEYCPYRTIGESSYSVTVGASYDGDFSGNGSFSYSKSLPDTDINVSSSSKYVEWKLDLDDQAQKQTITFEPAITFDCPENKSSVKITVDVDYHLDSWNTFNEIVNIYKTVTCYPSNLSQ